MMLLLYCLLLVSLARCVSWIDFKTLEDREKHLDMCCEKKRDSKEFKNAPIPVSWHSGADSSRYRRHIDQSTTWLCQGEGIAEDYKLN